MKVIRRDYSPHGIEMWNRRTRAAMFARCGCADCVARRQRRFVKCVGWLDTGRRVIDVELETT